MGDVCGYQVRLSSNLPRAPGGVLLFCTAGTLLRRLSTSPDVIKEYDCMWCSCDIL